MASRRSAIYTRKSSEEGLEQDYNSLHAHLRLAGSTAQRNFALLISNRSRVALSGSADPLPVASLLLVFLDF